MSLRSIMKAIKYGLLSLTSEELKYFQGFGVEIKDTWTKEKLDEKLIWNLVVTGLTENQCWNIIMCGLVSQDENILYRLLSSGIDVPGILSWSEKSKPVTPTMIRFLKALGMDDDTLCYVKENGIDDESEDMLIDLGYNEYKEKELLQVTEEILCECSLTILESHSIPLEAQTASDTASDSPSLKSFSSCSLNTAAPLSSVSTSMWYNSAACTCYLNLLPKGEDGETLKRNDYLRQNVMVPLSWAIGRALRYQPSDPIYYIAQQLLRWKYGNVPQEEVHNAQQFVASATIIMDRRLVEKRKREEEDAVRRLNEAAMKDIICNICLERQKLYRIKERCWKCTRVPIRVEKK
ncbi:major centromere autoantigen [Lasius niger]|uniref:Major centromere autoantigen n=1 Tax=Lasius niger TaxID=67767 RepID=A0A0J7KYQ9_LASNI|nr:major centromere autoantigen [Lasius niger]